MGNVRRWYIYLVCLISLETVAWAVIILLRHMLGGHPYASTMTTAWQLSLVLIGLPLFLGHWLWAQRLARREPEERTATLRYLYLYALLAATLSTVAGNAYTLVAWLVDRVFATAALSNLSALREPADSLVGIAVMLLLWLYHRQVLAEDAAAVPLAATGKTVRRLYLLGFSAAGLFLTVLGVSGLLYGIARQLTPGPGPMRPYWLPGELARLAVGLALWLPFWSSAQHLFAGGDEDEQAAVLRKVYLYAASFLPALAFVTAMTVLLANVFQRLLGVAPPGFLTLWRALAVVLATAPIWAYHAALGARDAAAAPERPQQAAIRRIYLYLVAAVGLATFLIGLAGDVSVLIRGVAGVVAGRSLQVQLAWYSAALLAGLPVWVLPWRQTQSLAAAAGPDGDAETRSLVRRIYLYFFLFAAAMTVLSSGAYLFARVIGRMLGAIVAGNLASEVGQALAFSLIGAGVWLYHSDVLRRDNARSRHAAAQRLAGLHVSVVDPGDGTLGEALLAGLRRRLPDVQIAGYGPALAVPTPVAPASVASAVAGAEPIRDMATALDQADIVVGPWTIATGSCDPELAAAVAASPAHKLLIPVDGDGWQWTGRASPRAGDLVEQALDDVVQLAVEGQIGATRRLGAGAIVGIVLFILVMIPVVFWLIETFTRLLGNF